LGSEIIEDAPESLEGWVGRVVRSHNGQAVIKAGGALAWETGEHQRTIEFRLFGQELRAIKPRRSFNLHGFYLCLGSGNEYKFYGRCTAFTAGRESMWEAYLFHKDKKFRYDGVFNSPDLLAKLSGPLMNIQMDVELVRSLAISELEAAIEKWDSDLGRQHGRALSNSK
jgi:hypothetical protein